MRFVILGLIGLFGAQCYVAQTVTFGSPDPETDRLVEE